MTCCSKRSVRLIEVKNVENLYIGIDIGGTNLRFALVSGLGKILFRSRSVSGIADGREVFCTRLLAGIVEMQNFATTQGMPVSGLGVGVPGLVGRDGVIHSSVNMKPLDGLNLTRFLKDATGLPVVCANDANVIAMGEYIYGAGTDFRSFMVISIGTGLGSGLILDGRLWSGVDGFASEFGHLTVKPDGLPCPCGNRGCLEQYVSAGAIVRYAVELFSGHPQGAELLLDASIVAGLARKGEPAARKAFETAGSWLGIGLASLANTLNLEAIIVCGGVSESLELFLPATRAELEKRCFSEIGTNLKILAGSLSDDAGLLGAAGMVKAAVA